MIPPQQVRVWLQMQQERAQSAWWEPCRWYMQSKYKAEKEEKSINYSEDDTAQFQLIT